MLGINQKSNVTSTLSAKKSNPLVELKGWCQLLRLPNLFTLPGDCAVGYVIADGKIISSNFLYAILSIIFIYSYGLITNDIADINEDKKQRPERPIPSGTISILQAKIAALLMIIASIFTAYQITINVFYTVLALLFIITTYNFLLKRNSILGPFALGICRICTILIGFKAGTETIQFPPILYIVIITWFFYFFALSLAAYHETDLTKMPRGLFILFPIPIIWITTIPLISGALYPVYILKEINPSLFLALASTLIFSGFILTNSVYLITKYQQKGIVSKSIGTLIWNIIFLQASCCAFCGFPYLALIIFLLAIPARISAKKFYAS